MQFRVERRCERRATSDEAAHNGEEAVVACSLLLAASDHLAFDPNMFPLGDRTARFLEDANAVAPAPAAASIHHQHENGEEPPPLVQELGSANEKELVIVDLGSTAEMMAFAKNRNFAINILKRPSMFFSHAERMVIEAHLDTHGVLRDDGNTYGTTARCTLDGSVVKVGDLYYDTAGVYYFKNFRKTSEGTLQCTGNNIDWKDFVEAAETPALLRKKYYSKPNAESSWTPTCFQKYIVSKYTVNWKWVGDPWLASIGRKRVYKPTANSGSRALLLLRGRHQRLSRPSTVQLRCRAPARNDSMVLPTVRLRLRSRSLTKHPQCSSHTAMAPPAPLRPANSGTRVDEKRVRDVFSKLGVKDINELEQVFTKLGVKSVNELEQKFAKLGVKDINELEQKLDDVFDKLGVKGFDELEQKFEDAEEELERFWANLKEAAEAAPSPIERAMALLEVSELKTKVRELELEANREVTLAEVKNLLLQMRLADERNGKELLQTRLAAECRRRREILGISDSSSKENRDGNGGDVA